SYERARRLPSWSAVRAARRARSSPSVEYGEPGGITTQPELQARGVVGLLVVTGEQARVLHELGLRGIPFVADRAEALLVGLAHAAAKHEVADRRDHLDGRHRHLRRWLLAADETRDEHYERALHRATVAL